jgi:hypothetical protein
MLAAVRLIADISSTHVLERVDALGGLLNLAANDLGDQLLGELSQSAGAGLALHDLGHLLADGPDLRRSGVGGLLDLVGPALGEADSEEAEQVVVGGLDDNVGLNEGLPLADERAELVGGEVEAVEVGQAVLALDLVDAELDLAEGVVLILLEIGEGNLEYPSLEGVVGVLQTGGAVDEGLADTACGQYACAVQIAAAACWGVLLPDRESSGRLDVVPVLLSEGVGLLLKTLLALRETLVLSDSHGDDSCVGVLWLVLSWSRIRRSQSVGRVFRKLCQR